MIAIEALDSERRHGMSWILSGLLMRAWQTATAEFWNILEYSRNPGPAGGI